VDCQPRSRLPRDARKSHPSTSCTPSPWHPLVFACSRKVNGVQGMRLGRTWGDVYDVGTAITETSELRRPAGARCEGSEDAAREFVATYGPPILRVVRRQMNKCLRSKYDSIDFEQSVWASFFAQDLRAPQIRGTEWAGHLPGRAGQEQGDRRHAPAARRGKYDVRQEHSLESDSICWRRMPLSECRPPVRWQWPRRNGNSCWKAGPEVHQRILVLRQRGYSPEEIAAEMACRPGPSAGAREARHEAVTMKVAELFRSAVRTLGEGSRAAASPCEELIAEVKARWAQGKPVDVRELLARDPKLWKDRSIVLELAYEEYCLHAEAGECLDPDAFCARFPNFRNSLHTLLFAHGLYAESLERRADAKLDSLPGPGGELAGYVPPERPGSRSLLPGLPGSRAAGGESPGRLEGMLARGDHRGRRARQTQPSAHRSGVLGPTWSGRRANNHLHALPGQRNLCDVLDQVFVAGEPPAQGRAILTAIQERTIPGEAIMGLLAPDRPLQTGTYVDAVTHIGLRLADAWPMSTLRASTTGTSNPPTCC